MAWRFFLLVAAGASFAGGLWIGQTPTAAVCQIDLRNHAKAAFRALNEHPAFLILDDGTQVAQQPCRVRIGHDDGGTLDHTFSWAALTRDQTGERLLLKIDELSLNEAYEQVLAWIVKLYFDNESLDRLEQWRRRVSGHDPSVLEIIKRTHRPTLSVSIAPSSLGANRWRVTLELQP